MANGFRFHAGLFPEITTGRTGVMGYVSPAGVAGNPGSAEAPWPSMQDGGYRGSWNQDGVYVIGAGDYFCDEINSGYAQYSYYADGEVIWRPSNANTPGYFYGQDGGGSGSTKRYKVFTFFGYQPLTFGHTSGDNYTGHHLHRCKVIATAADQVNFTKYETHAQCIIWAYDSLFKRVVMDPIIGSSFNPSYTLFYLCGAIYVGSAQYCYFDTTSTVYCNAGGLTNCNVRGKLVVGGTPYENLAAAKAAGVIDATNLSADPRFNKPEADDFSLRSDSPHLSRGIGPRHLKLGLGVYFDTEAIPNSESITTAAAQNSRFVSTLTGQSISLLSTSGFIVNSRKALVVKPNSNGTFEGTLKTSRIFVSDVDVELEAINYAGGLNFNTAYPATESSFNSAQPEVFNNNVPKFIQTAAGSSGRNPNRLTYLIRWSTLPDPDPTQDADWVTGGNYVEMEYGQKPLWNGNAANPLGTGAPTFSLSSGVKIFCKFIQVQQRQRNNFYK